MRPKKGITATNTTLTQSICRYQFENVTGCSEMCIFLSPLLALVSFCFAISIQKFKIQKYKIEELFRRIVWRNKSRGCKERHLSMPIWEFENQIFLLGLSTNFGMGRFMRPGTMFAARPVRAHVNYRATLRDASVFTWNPNRSDLRRLWKIGSARFNHRFKRLCGDLPGSYLASGVTYWSECGYGPTPWKPTTFWRVIQFDLYIHFHLDAVSYTRLVKYKQLTLTYI